MKKTFHDKCGLPPRDGILYERFPWVNMSLPYRCIQEAVPWATEWIWLYYTAETTRSTHYPLRTFTPSPQPLQHIGQLACRLKPTFTAVNPSSTPFSPPQVSTSIAPHWCDHHGPTNHVIKDRKHIHRALAERDAAAELLDDGASATDPGPASTRTRMITTQTIATNNSNDLTTDHRIARPHHRLVCLHHHRRLSRTA
jgi:hypothetical protein